MEEQGRNETTPVEIKEEFDEDITIKLESIKEEVLDEGEKNCEIPIGQQPTIIEQQQNQQQDQQQQINNNEPENVIAEQIPSWSTNLNNSGYPGFIEAIRQARNKKQSHDVSFEILFSYLPESAIKQHDLNLKEWWNYCLFENKDPLETDLSVVNSYFDKKLDAGASPDDLESISSTIRLIASDTMEKQMNSLRFLFINNTDCYKTPKSSCQNDSITLSLDSNTKKQDESKISSVQIENVQKAKLSEVIDISDDELDTESPTKLLKKSKDLLNNNEPTNLKENSVFLQKTINSSQLITPLKKPKSTKPPAILLCPASKKKVLENIIENQQITIKNTSSRVPSISNVVADESDSTNGKYPTLIMPILKQQGKVIQQQQSTLSESDSKSISDLSDTSIHSDNSLDEIGPTNETESYAYLQKDIDNPQTAIVQDQVEGNVVKMLVVMPDGDQRLITFDIPNEKITVNDLLEQTSIPFNGTTTVSLVKDPICKINYIVESETGTIVDSTDTSDDNNELSDKKCLQDDNDDNNIHATSTVNIEEPKYIDGKLAVCDKCGLTSMDFNRCYYCKKKIQNTKTKLDKSQPSQKRHMMLSIDGFYKSLLNNDTGDVNGELSNDGSVFPDRKYLQADDDDDNNDNGDDDNNEKNTRKSLKLQSALKCRTVKIGSYKYTPKEHVIINTTGLILSVPLLEDETKTVKVHVQYQDIYKVLIHSDSSRPKLFFYTNAISGSKIRKLLGMNNPKGPYFDPAGEDQTHKRIILFPKLLKSDSINILKKLFSSNTFVKELNAKEADAMLTKDASLKKPNSSSSKIGKRQTTIANANNIVENSTIHSAAPTKDEDTNKSITKSKCAKLSSINKNTNAYDKNNEKSNTGNDKLANSNSRKKTSSVIIKKPKLGR